jgi:hypothetical protein
MSVLEAMGTSSSECGYCHAPGQSSISRGMCAALRCAALRWRSRARRAGMWAHRLTVDDYQGATPHCAADACTPLLGNAAHAAARAAELVDRGWRRSGRWLYKARAAPPHLPPVSRIVMQCRV